MQAQVLPVDEVPLYGTGRARRRRLLRQVLTVAAGVLACLLVGGGTFVATQRNVSTEVSLDQAVLGFRTEVAAAPVGEVKVEEQAPALADGDEKLPRTEVAAPAEDPGSDPAAGADQVTEAPGSYRLPLEGVYAYRTRGGENVSMFNAKHNYPERTFATVRHQDGCLWEFRNEVIKEHVDVLELCSAIGQVSQLAQSRLVTFFGQTDGSRMTCAEPFPLHIDGEEPGARYEGRCTDGKGGDATMVRTFVGTDRLPVGGTAVNAVAITITGVMTGKVEGESFDAFWLHPETGLILRWERKVDTLATAYGAKVRYREDASFVLEHLMPHV